MHLQLVSIGSDTSNDTNEVIVNWYRGSCPDGTLSCDPDLQPNKTVSTKYTNDITTFDCRVSQLVPALPRDGESSQTAADKTYKWNSLILTDTIDKVFDMSKTQVKVIDTRYGDSEVDYFDITINDHTITATAKASALAQDNFYGTTYEMVITTKVTEEFDFTGYQQTVDANGDNVYTIINNQAERKFKDKYNTEYTSRTPEVPTIHVNPKIPNKAVDTEMIRSEKDYHYTINQDIQPATEDNYYDSFIFTDVLEPPLQIRSTSDVKINQITLDINGNEVSKKDYTSNFDITLSGNNKNTITAKAKTEAIKNADFYGTREEGTDKEILKRYEFILTVSLRNDAENIMDMSKYIDETGLRYKIPNKASIKTKTPGNNEIDRETNEVQVYYYPDPDPVKFVSEENVTELYKQGKTFKFKIDKRILDYPENLRFS